MAIKPQDDVSPCLLYMLSTFIWQFYRRLSYVKLGETSTDMIMMMMCGALSALAMFPASVDYRSIKSPV